MSFFQMLYQLIIGPLELLIETVYVFSYEIPRDYGLAIFPLSLCVNFFLLPLYNRAEAIQAVEREREKNMSKGVSHIKKTFKGDERYMMLKAYYRINNYKPIYSLRSSLPLALEIPFFVAAYHFLSNLTLLKYSGLGPIADLSAPDRLISIGSVSINVLPILMTLINLVSSRIYSGNLSKRENIQLYGMALVFLVLLYNSPSGLVVYWTLNNVFSLIKNIVNKSKNRDRFLCLLMSCLGICVWVWAYFYYYMYAFHVDFKVRLLGLIGLTFFIPTIIRLFRKIKPLSLKQKMHQRNMKETNKVFVYSCLLLSVLVGFLIPSTIVKTSPAEFVILSDYSPAVNYVFSALLYSVGLFVIWLSLFYYLSNELLKKIFSIIMLVLSFEAVINYMFFGTNLGNLSSQFIYESGLDFSYHEYLINSIVLTVVALALGIIWFKKKKIITFVYPIAVISIIIMSVVNTITIVTYSVGLQEQASKEGEVVIQNDRASITLSKSGNNVIVFMLDRAINAYVPYIMNEKPELVEKFDGFTYYPNTVSFGAYTNTGSPSLFGGYEYTPEEINRRDDLYLEQKQNEALCVMPLIFDNAGYDVTVLDPPYAGYSWVPDLSIYDQYENIKAYNTVNGQFADFRYDAGSSAEKMNDLKKTIWKRNLFCFSLMKSSPLFIQNELYDGGNYYCILGLNNELSSTQRIVSAYESVGVGSDFADSYAVLCALPYMTNVTDETQNYFIMMQNDSTHTPTLLKEPEYEPASVVNNTEYDLAHTDRFILYGRQMHNDTGEQMSHYQSNMAAFIKIGEWMDYLREKGVYDNTRIIIVADHGRGLGQFDDMILGTDKLLHGYNPEDLMFYNPLLMVKDFNSSGFITDNSFMTNADTPTLALEGLIDDPVNPFTGVKINDDAKYDPELHIFSSDGWIVYTNEDFKFKPGVWYSLKNQNIFELSNWEEIGEY